MLRMRSRRFVALVAAFAVAFGALWPLVSAARPTPAAIPNFICGQSGFHAPQEVSPASEDPLAKFHCALCVAVAESAPATPLPAPGWTVVDGTRAAPPVATRFVPRWLARPPPSHAPPTVS